MTVNRKQISPKSRRSRVAKLRALYGDNCLHCGEPMLFDPEHAGHPDYRTLEHWPAPWRICRSNQIDRLRLAHQRCNVEDDLKGKVAEGLVRPGALNRLRSKTKKRLAGMATIAAPATSKGAASQPARQPEGE